ncbi:MAG: class I SAM-dependent methyltransferase [Phycisphaerae bacterium]|nr:class I SAM-dependent methyltransferase [Phycisphaerae bacterium]
MPRSSSTGTFANADRRTVEGFGREWSAFDQSSLSAEERQRLFGRYFSLIGPEGLDPSAEVLDVGCGSGRWASVIAPRVGHLALVDASGSALQVARRNLDRATNVSFHLASAGDLPFADESFDLVYSLGVLHHVPDTESAIRSCASKVRQGGKLLLYLYYRFDDRPWWFRALWKVSDACRRVICRLPFGIRRRVTDLIALVVYLPLARLARLLDRLGACSRPIPLSFYRDASLYTMRTDSLDRFGTRLERRFTRSEIAEMLRKSGLVEVRFREDEPYWCVVGTKLPRAQLTGPPKRQPETTSVG